MSDEGFLSRWSRRKRAAAAVTPSEGAGPAPVAAPPGEAGVVPPVAASPAASTSGAPLPPVESLSIESDFAPFMAQEVDPSLKRAALRKLFEDERFNVMDGLDVYIDDYTKPAPIPPEWYERMAQMAHLGDAAPRPAPAAAAEADAQAPAAGAEGAAAQPAPAADISHNDVSSGEAETVPRDGAPG